MITSMIAIDWSLFFEKILHAPKQTEEKTRHAHTHTHTHSPSTTHCISTPCSNELFYTHDNDAEVMAQSETEIVKLVVNGKELDLNKSVMQANQFFRGLLTKDSTLKKVCLNIQHPPAAAVQAGQKLIEFLTMKKVRDLSPKRKPCRNSMRFSSSSSLHETTGRRAVQFARLFCVYRLSRRLVVPL
jgi:hypothetical protein